MTGFLDMAGAAGFLCRSPRWIRGRLHEIPHYKTGQILFRKSDLEQYMERFRVEPKGVDIQEVVNRVCGKSKLRRPIKNSRATRRGNEDRRSAIECGPGKGIGSRIGPDPDHTVVG